MGLICYRIAEPLWEGGHHGFVMSEYPHNALNYLRFGYKETKLGLVMNYGDQKPVDGFSYRVDHPMLTSVLISLAYRAFGVSPWSARMFPAIFALGTSFLTWVLSHQLLKNRWSALVALIVCALSPMITYYGRMPAPHNLSAFFALAFFYFYWRWFVTKSDRHFILSLLVFSAGAYTDWIIYFAAPAVVIHYLIFRKRERDWKRVLILALIPFVLFSLYIAK
jgi:4-amino-4-deoxy-L-arabinose transferase-like glycosyltransferase